MASPARPFALDLLIRTLRFTYLLWGGMLLCTNAAGNRLKPPAWLWEWPRIATFLGTPLCRGLALGVGVVMAIAALVEVWELVDRILTRILNDPERNH